MHNKSIKLLVFDWDGTLADSTTSIVTAMQATIVESGMEPRGENDIKNIIGLGLQEAVSILYPELNPAAREDLAQKYRLNYSQANFGKTRLFPGVVSTLEHLNKRGYRMAIATGKSRKGLDNSLRDTGISDFFHYSRCSDESVSKPHPQMLIDIMNELDYTADQTAMIGDSEYDIQMAHGAGASPIAAVYGSQSREHLLKYNPVACLNRITDLVDWLITSQD